MKYDNVLGHLDVDDFDVALSWYAKFFGRPTDRLPMDGTAEWQLTAGGGIQLCRTAGPPATVILGVSDVDEAIAETAEREINLAVDENLSGKFGPAFVKDPGR